MLEMMDSCMVERAFKSSLRRELPAVLNSSSVTQQSCFDDLTFDHSDNAGVEDFSVEPFFDFSNGGEFEENNTMTNATACIQEQQQYMIDVVDEEEEEEEEQDCLYVFSQECDNYSNSNTFDDSLRSDELVVPIDDLAELEWVSRFVDDSSSEFSLSNPLKSENIHARNSFQPQNPEPIFALVTEPSSCLFPANIPGKPRSKRTRHTGRTWLFNSLLTDSLSYSSSSSQASSSASTPCFATVDQTINSLPSLNEHSKKKPAAQTIEVKGLTRSFQRRCSHCQVQKTPQWRAGPLGAKTLCNACGVRYYKSARLVPEYRPACSPTFSSNLHSNSPRKALGIRKRKK